MVICKCNVVTCDSCDDFLDGHAILEIVPSSGGQQDAPVRADRRFAADVAVAQHRRHPRHDVVDVLYPPSVRNQPICSTVALGLSTRRFSVRMYMHC